MRPTPNHVHYAKVLEWHDGDTVKLDGDLDYEAHQHPWHRLYGVDTPELVDKETGEPNPAGYAALDFVRALAPVGTDLVIVSYKNKNQVPTSGAREKYGRWLAEIWLLSGPADQPSINQMLIDAGHSKVYLGGKRQ